MGCQAGCWWHGWHVLRAAYGLGQGGIPTSSGLQLHGLEVRKMAPASVRPGVGAGPGPPRRRFRSRRKTGESRQVWWQLGFERTALTLGLPASEKGVMLAATSGRFWRGLRSQPQKHICLCVKKGKSKKHQTGGGVGLRSRDGGLLHSWMVELHEGIVSNGEFLGRVGLYF